MARQALEYPLPFRVLRTLFPILEFIAPRAALNLSVYLFLKPMRFPMTSKQKEAMSTFKIEKQKIGSHEVVTYTKGEGPEVLFMHGWSGRAMQFWALADEVTKAGYKCVLVDGPGHGASSRGRTNIFEFVDVFSTLVRSSTNCKAVIGHSLGAAAISLAVADGLNIPAFVTMGAPVVGQDILKEYIKRINGSQNIIDGMRERSLSEFGREFDDVAMEQTFKSVICPTICFHGTEDLDVPVYHLEVLKSIKPDTQTFAIEGIGHRRVLKDERVILPLLKWLEELV